MNQINKKFKSIILSITLFGSIISFVNIVYPSPSWMDICSGPCDSDEQLIIANNDIVYRNNIKNLFILIAFVSLFLFLSVCLSNKFRKQKLTFLSLFLLLLLYVVVGKFSYILFGYGSKIGIWPSFFLFLFLSLSSVILYKNIVCYEYSDFGKNKSSKIVT